jgi:hypothetical protein
MKYLSMQIRQFNNVIVYETEYTNASASEIEGSGAAEATEADNEDTGGEEACLAGEGEGWDEDGAGVAGCG